MIVLISLLSLSLFHSVRCQIQSPEEAREVACRVTINGFSGDPECAIAASRFILVTNGIQQTLSTANLNQICGPTACADLVYLASTLPCNDDRTPDPVRQYFYL